MKKISCKEQFRKDYMELHNEKPITENHTNSVDFMDNRKIENINIKIRFKNKRDRLNEAASRF